MNACLLHRDYHVLDQDCWRYRITWMQEHMHISYEWRAEFYQQAVESAIMGDLWRVRRHGH